MEALCREVSSFSALRDAVHSGSRHSRMWVEPVAMANRCSASQRVGVYVGRVNPMSRGSRCADTQPLRRRVQPPHGILHFDASPDVLSVVTCIMTWGHSRNMVDTMKIALAGVAHAPKYVTKRLHG